MSRGGQMLVEVEFLAGSDILDAVKEAKVFAQRFDCGVAFMFNEVRMAVWPQSEVADEVRWFLACLAEQTKRGGGYL